MARFTTLARSLKTLAPAAAGAAILALATGCCCGAGHGGYGSYYGAPAYGGGCDSGQCGGGQCGGGYGAGYGAPIYPQGAMAAPAGPVAAAPVYYQTAAAPAPTYYAAPQTAAAPVNCVPTH